MAGKYGKKNVVSKKITDYNIAILGLSGIGKTTLMKETCEKLVGEDGYMIFNMGKEDGIACIDGAVYENIESWKKFDEVTKDIIKNKATDYPDLKVVVIDTIDQLFEITEPEVIRRWNQEKMGEKGFKPVTSINAAYGGFGEGLNRSCELILNKIWDLKSVGLAVWMCGHTKNKDIIDPLTDQTYTTISANLSQKYFNAIKTKMHIVGMAVIDRDIVTESTGRKNIVTNKDITKNKIVSEARKIIFRDDNYGVDSKSRFRHIVDEIPLNADAFIKAIQDAINNEKKGDDEVEASKPEPAPAPVEEPEDEVTSEEEAEDDFPMNTPEEPEDILETDDEYSDMTDEELAAEATKKFKACKDADTKAKVREIVKPFGKMSNVDRAGLIEVINLF